MTASSRRPWFPALVVLFVLGCSSGSSGGGCGSGSTTKTCDIELTATTCPGEITLECHDGATPFSKSQCKEALKQDTDVVYCCANNAEPDANGGGGGS